MAADDDRRTSRVCPLVTRKQVPNSVDVHAAAKCCHPFNELVSPRLVDIGERDPGDSARVGSPDLGECMHGCPEPVAIDSDLCLAR